MLLIWKGEIQMEVNREYLEGKIWMANDGIADRHEWFRKGFISAEVRDLDIKRFEGQKYNPQVLLDIMNGVPIRL
jgi:hypothetical protein